MAQLKATRAAAIRVVRAHVDLAKAEANEIKGEALRALALGGLAAASAIFLVFLLLIGLMLFIGEWLFGSLGWGVLLGAELLIAAAVFAGLGIVRSSGLTRAFAIAARRRHRRQHRAGHQRPQHALPAARDPVPRDLRPGRRLVRLRARRSGRRSSASAACWSAPATA